jgi:hypothetical protein
MSITSLLTGLWHVNVVQYGPSCVQYLCELHPSQLHKLSARRSNRSMMNCNIVYWPRAVLPTYLTLLSATWWAAPLPHDVCTARMSASNWVMRRETSSTPPPHPHPSRPKVCTSFLASPIIPFSSDYMLPMSQVPHYVELFRLRVLFALHSTSSFQPGVRVLPGVREHILGGYAKTSYINEN